MDNVVDVKVVELQSGFAVFELPSGYTVRVKRTGPFLFDILESREDLKDPGPMMIKVQLMAKLAPDAQLFEEIVYEPPTDDDGKPVCPDREEYPQAWAYYQQWLAHERHRREIRSDYEFARTETFLLNSIDVIDGEPTVDDNVWLNKLEAVLDKPPITWSDRYLLFLKTQVLTTSESWEVIRDYSMAKEVTLEGIKHAFDTFRREIQRAAAIASNEQAA